MIHATGSIILLFIIPILTQGSPFNSDEVETFPLLMPDVQPTQVCLFLISVEMYIFTRLYYASVNKD